MTSRLALALLLLLSPVLHAETKPASHGVFQELPVTAIKPQGWLAEILRRQKDGLALHRSASGFPFDSVLWNGKIPDAKWPAYEQTAYFVDGSYRCGLLLGDKTLTDQGLDNIKYVLSHPQPNGRLGPGPDDMKLKVGPDGVAGPTVMGATWPMTVFTRALMAYYDETGDKAALDALGKHYLSLPTAFGVDNRDVNGIEGMCWLAMKTGDPQYIALAERTWANYEKSPSNLKKTGPIWAISTLPDAPALRGHGVSVSEISKQPALLYLATGKKEYLAAALGGFTSLKRDHELADGVLSSDAVLSGKAPEHQHETCVVPDYTWSLGYGLMASGEAHFGDSIERGIFNAGLSVIDRDFKSHQYYSSPNQMTATQSSNNPSTGTKNRNLQSFRPDFAPECCTGNVQRMLPNYVARMWMSDQHGSLAATLYGPCSVTWKAGPRQMPVTIDEKTDYPFSGKITFTVTAEKPVEFPLSLRIPEWAKGATVSINGKTETTQVGTFFTTKRKFTTGDTIELNLPMDLRLETPVDGGETIARGPLVFTVKIKEDKKEAGKSRAADPAFPSFDYTAASPWNYTLALNGPDDLAKIKVTETPITDYPWTADTSPVKLTVPAQKIPSWTLTEKGENPPLPKGDFAKDPAVEEIEMVPQGTSELHVTVFPASR